MKNILNLKKKIENLKNDLTLIKNEFDNISNEIEEFLKKISQQNINLIKTLNFKIKNILVISKDLIFEKDEFNILNQLKNSKINQHFYIDNFLKHSKILLLKNQILESNLKSIKDFQKDFSFKLNFIQIFFS